MINHLDEAVMSFFKPDDGAPDGKDSTSTDDEAEKARSEFLQELLEHLVGVGEAIAVQNPFLPKPKATGPRYQLPASAGCWRLRLVFYEKL